jgi:site-specific DNA-methyltransferase (adenine-specific)
VFHVKPSELTVHFSSKKHDWATPLDLFDHYNKIYDFSIDVCANESNAKCDRYFSLEEDGLSQSWQHEICWMNPPYGREISKWVKKAYDESLEGSEIVALLPARTDTAWFHDYILDIAKVEFLRGRVKFLEDGKPRHPAPFPSMIVCWDLGRHAQKQKKHRRTEHT